MGIIQKTKKAPEAIIMKGGKVAAGGIVAETLLDGVLPKGVLGILAKGVIGGYAASKIDNMFGLGILGSAGKDTLGLVGLGRPIKAAGATASRWL